MRISDWSADVCSSDLQILSAAAVGRAHRQFDRQCAVGDDFALGLGAPRLSLALWRGDQRAQDRRIPDPLGADAAQPRLLLRADVGASGADSAYLCRGDGGGADGRGAVPRAARLADPVDLRRRAARISARLPDRQCRARPAGRARLPLRGVTMRLTVDHSTHYHFDGHVAYALQQLRLTPKERPGQQVIHDWTVEVEGGRSEEPTSELQSLMRI